MLRYTLRRLLYAVITIWLIVTLTFVLMKNLPGDPFENSEKLTQEQKAILARQYGLDKPLSEQYFLYLGNVIKGDLGVSFQYPARKVTEVIGQGMGASMELGIWSILLALAGGITLGTIAALRHNTNWDYTAMFTAVAGVSIPSFVLGPLLSYFVGVKLKWLPPGLWFEPEHRILPAIALSFGTMAILARLMRTSMLDVVNQDYIKTAKAKGLSGSSIVLKHIFRNALLPIVTIIGPVFVGVITGTLVVEQIFSVPGLGKHFVQSILTNDYTMISGLTIFYSVILVFVLFLTDIAYGFIDPRIRLAKGKG
ncbi:ABC transporter permease [Paenibacillus mucilaginosus]|uniref:Oligopeptide ABC transporter permease n=3 Tax=Paenibacillus mucilaginosus TaxID=61624 RepID=H6NG94_9BACL|nr:ABC transporter permease [Paenibacillus mucilaginosus]AEI42615.1 oligopeptide ABC transporter (permease) [Paenibacillus mucilaginosus KNP414]AFC32221.1 oligopeptide ABC transporter permease [Paenibacillus mucilaginosus 3016]AFH64523.1 peptide ABC transporter permease [Paenibacillus mucilaginosus K02]MCG7214005.1 ABC transporter permease [Paenibacillus mucilaginosus]WDM26005.1 ABC transporter permease [Paenibacillus mucilaginosus]